MYSTPTKSPLKSTPIMYNSPVKPRLVQSNKAQSIIQTWILFFVIAIIATLFSAAYVYTKSF